MENTIKFNPDLGNIAMSAFMIEKIHRCADCPIRQARTCAFAEGAGTQA
jgi:hypothetical protein